MKSNFDWPSAGQGTVKNSNCQVKNILYLAMWRPWVPFWILSPKIVKNTGEASARFLRYLPPNNIL